MPRRPPREYHDNDSYDSDDRDRDRDRLPRRRHRPRREFDPIIDDTEPHRRRHSPPLEEMEHLRIRERSGPDYSYDEVESREPRRRSPRRRAERDEVEVDDRDRDRDRRRKYVERSSDDDDLLPGKGGGGWKPTSAGYTSEEESVKPERRRRRKVSEWDYERRSPPPRTRGREVRRRERVGSDEEIPVASGGWKPSAGFASDDGDEFVGRRRIRKEVPRAPDLEYERRDPFPRRSARDELEMEYAVDRDDFRDRAGSRSRSRSRSRFRDDEDDLRIRRDVRGRRGRGYWKDDRDDFPVRKKRVSPSVSPPSRGWSPDRSWDGHDDGMRSCKFCLLRLLISYRL